MTAPLASLADPTDERFTEAQRAKVAEFDAASEPPESFDPIAALRRVEALCDVADDQPDGYECRFIATHVVRAALAPQAEQ